MNPALDTAFDLLEKSRVAPPTARGRATRDRLLQAAEHCFSQNGFDGTTIADIAAHADVSHGNFYRHFDDKDGVLIAVIATLYGDLRKASGTVVKTTTPTLAGLTRRNIAFFRNYSENRHLFRVTREAAARPDAVAFRDMWLSIRNLFVERSARWIARCQANGDIGQDIDASALAAALGAMTEQLAYIELGLAQAEPSRATIERLGETCGLIWYRSLTRSDRTQGGGA